MEPVAAQERQFPEVHDPVSSPPGHEVQVGIISTTTLQVNIRMKSQCHNQVFSIASALPDGNGGFVPCPDVLTEDEVIRFLRLDLETSSDPRQTLKYYRDRGELVAIRLGRKNRYRRQGIDGFLAQKSACHRSRRNNR